MISALALGKFNGGWGQGLWSATLFTCISIEGCSVISDTLENCCDLHHYFHGVSS